MSSLHNFINSCIISVSHYVTLCHTVPLHYIYRFELDAPVQGIQASTFTLDEVPKTSIEIDTDGQRIEFCKDFRWTQYHDWLNGLARLSWRQTGDDQQVHLHHRPAGRQREAAGRGTEAAQLRPAHVRDGGGGRPSDRQSLPALHCHHHGRHQILVGTSRQHFSWLWTETLRSATGTYTGTDSSNLKLIFEEVQGLNRAIEKITFKFVEILTGI